MAETRKLTDDSAELPEVNDMWTMVPVWQQKIIAGTIVFACVSLPVCKRHMVVEEMSAADKAIQNGRLLQG